MFVVYNKPTDYPTEYVVRRHEVDSTETLGSVPKEIVMKSEDLSEIRTKLDEMGLVYIKRHPKDDPVILETWL